MKISVITVAWNAAATLGDTLRSVAAQDHADIEHLVMDGGSTDDSAAVFAANAGPAAQWHSAPDRGLYDAMNRGLARATGDLIGFLNADDFYCRTDALSLVARAAAIQRADAVAGGVAIVDPADTSRLRRAYGSGAAPWMLRFGHMPPHPGFYARMDAVRQVGDFDLTAGTAADFDWMVRFFLVHRFTAQRIAPTLVTMRAGGVSNAGLSNLARANAQAHAALRRHGRTSARSLIWAKYAAKSWQVVARPHAWPAPPAVRWPNQEVPA